MATEEELRDAKILRKDAEAEPSIEGNDGREYEAKEYEVYLDHRKVLVDTELEQSRAFDRTVLTVSSGALALSIGFIEHVAAPVPEMPFLLYLGWIAFCSAILSTLFSFSFSVQDSKRRRRQHDLNYEKGNRRSAKENIFTKIVRWLNWASLFSVAIGVILLTCFAMVNFENRSNLMISKAQPTTRTPNSPTDVGKGAESISPPAAQRQETTGTSSGSTTTSQTSDSSKDK